MLATIWMLVIYFFAVILLVTAMLGGSFFLGQRHHNRGMDEPYESGIVSTGDARIRFDVKFYLNAMFFVIFDLEAIFIFSWAVALRQVGWAGFVEVLIFIGVLFAALIYLWKSGALDWETPREKRDLLRRSRMLEASMQPEIGELERIDLEGVNGS